MNPSMQKGKNTKKTAATKQWRLSLSFSDTAPTAIIPAAPSSPAPVDTASVARAHGSDAARFSSMPATARMTPIRPMPAAGNPAREIRKRFGEAEIAMLLEMRWWDWPIEEIRAALDLLCSGDVAGLHARWAARGG